MITRIETYKGLDIDKVSDAPINNIFKTENGEIFHACKLDFSQPMNYLDIYGDTLERCKENIDFYMTHKRVKFVR